MPQQPLSRKFRPESQSSSVSSSVNRDSCSVPLRIRTGIDRLLPLGLALAIGWIAWLWLDRSPPLEFAGGIVSPDPIRAGNWVQIIWRLRWKRACNRIEIKQTLVSATGLIHALETIDATAEKPTEDFISIGRAIHIPWVMSAGIAEYRVTVLCVCNPLQELWPLAVQAPSLRFNVIESPVTTQERLLSPP